MYKSEDDSRSERDVDNLSPAKCLFSIEPNRYTVSGREGLLKGKDKPVPQVRPHSPSTKGTRAHVMYNLFLVGTHLYSKGSSDSFGVHCTCIC